MMKKLFSVVLTCMPLAAVAAAGTATVQVPLQVKANLFSPTTMDFSANGEQVCIAGADHTEMGTRGGRLILVDRVHGTLSWQKTFPLPEHYASIAPIQCRIVDNRVYLLANMITHLSPSLGQTLTYLYIFDAQGRQVAREELSSPARDQVAYAMDVSKDAVQVAGYLMDQDEDFEYYSTFTQSLDRSLKPLSAPVVRKTGAYAPFPGARIVGDSLYIGGVFVPAKVGKRDAWSDDFAASRMRLTRGYAWSAHSKFGTHSDTRAGVAEDGTVYALQHGAGRTSLLAVPPGGSPLPVVTYASSYCDTDAVLGYGTYVLALRAPCDGKARKAVLKIDPATGHETVLSGAIGEPVEIATKGALWSAVAKGKDGRLYFHSAWSGTQ